MIAFRPATPDDHRFVVSTWLDSYRTSYTAGMIPMNRWRVIMEPIVLDLMAKDGTQTIVAHETDAEAATAPHYGFICCTTDIRPPCVYYIFVLQPYREAKKRLGRSEGVATSLFREAGINPDGRFSFACKTRVVAELAKANKIPLAKFAPLIARFENPRGD